MSLAYKLWKIGSILKKDDVRKTLQEIPEDNGKNYININFEFNDYVLTDITLSRDSISKDRLFFSKKIGGTSNAYYLYPNNTVLNDSPAGKINLLRNTLEYGAIKFASCVNHKIITTIINEINKKEGAFSDILKRISEFQKDDYWIWLSVNGKTFYELMPEIFDNWYEHPVDAEKIMLGYDIFTNKETEVGFKPEVKVFSYDQYHDSLNFRIVENLSLSLESARNIKFAWMFILDNLVFYYKGLEYIIIPNLLSDNNEIYRIIIDRLIQASKRSAEKRGVITELRKEEEQLKKKIERAANQNNDTKRKLDEIEFRINDIDNGIVRELTEQILTLDEHLNSVTIDYIFTSINRTNLSFEIKGSIEDIVPSNMSKVVKEMNEFKIDDLVKLGGRDREKTLLQDYFSRSELYFVVNKSSNNNVNKIFEERLYLTKLLLTDIQIKFDDLLERIEFNRFYNYEQKKRISDDGCQDWIKYHKSMVGNDNNLINFLRKINKIKED